MDQNTWGMSYNPPLATDSEQEAEDSVGKSIWTQQYTMDSLFLQ